MNAKLSFAALITVFLLLNANVASARKKEAAAPDATYLDCLQHGMTAAPPGDPATIRMNVLGDCVLVRRATATITMALLILGGESEKRAGAHTDELMAADDEKVVGIPRQDDMALFATFESLEKELGQAKADYRRHPDGQVECVVTQSSGDPDVDAARCSLPQGCPSLNGSPGANNKAAFACMATAEIKQLWLLAVSRTGHASLPANDGVPAH